MSMTLMAKAMKIKVGNHLRKLVLIKMADNANDKGECWPSYRDIADHCECSKSGARAHVDALIRMGLIAKENRLGEKNGKGNTSNLYYLTLDNPVSSKITAPCATKKHSPMPSKNTGVCQQVAPPAPADSTPPMPPDGTRISHSFEPVIEPKEKPTQTLPAELDSGGEGFRDFLADLLRNRFPATDAATLHDQAVELLSQHGLTCRREFPVDDRGDGRGGKVDILVTDESGRRCGIELDWKSPRRKSITKLNSIGGGLVVLRDVNHRGDYLDSGVLVIGGCKPEVLADRAGEVLDFLNSKINSRTPKRADTLREIIERLAEGHTVGELNLVAEHRASQLLSNPELGHMLSARMIFDPTRFGGYLAAAKAWNAQRAKKTAMAAAVEQQRQTPPTVDVPEIDFDGSFERLFVEGLLPENPAEKLAWQHVQKYGFKSPVDEVASRKEWRVILNRACVKAGRSEA